MRMSIEELLEKPYWIVDILPEQVKQDSPGQYFAVEKYFLTGSRKNRRCWYWTRIHLNYLFHSVIYDNSSSPRHIVDGTMGRSVSHGCIRLAVSNAKWIYDKMPRGTKIVIYN